MLSDPRKRKLCSTAARAPLPSASIAITAATPITTPSIVSTARSLFAVTPRMALAIKSSGDIVDPIYDLPIAHRQGALGVRGNTGIMRHHDNGAPLRMQIAQQGHDVGPGARIQ